MSNGVLVPFEQISDYRKMARVFSEGNEKLEKLLLSCFFKGIKTHACCAGHVDERKAPYIAFEYNLQNEQLFYALLSRLYDSGLNFTYSKVYDNPSHFAIAESADFSYYSTIFEDIYAVIDEFDKDMDYYLQLPNNLQKYFSIIKEVENYSYPVEKNESGYFQIRCRK